MTITINNSPHELPEGTTLQATLTALSPYGAEPVIVLINGQRVESDAALSLQDGDGVAIFPLLIGG